MNNIIPLSHIQSYFPNISPENVSVAMHIYRKKGKKEPDWLIKVPNKRGHLVELKGFERWATLDERIKHYATTDLYWLFVAMGFNDYRMSKFFASRSKYYKTVSTWSDFFACRLFMRSDEQGYRVLYEPTRATEFVRIGTKYIYLLKKWGKFEIKDKDVFGVENVQI